MDAIAAGWFGFRDQSAVGGATVAPPRFGSCHPNFHPSLNQLTSWLLCHSCHESVGVSNKASYRDIGNHLHAVLVLYSSCSSSLDHISGSSSSLLLSEPVWHILKDTRFVRRFQRSRSKPEKPFERVFGLSMANNFSPLESYLANEHCARAPLDGALLGIYPAEFGPRIQGTVRETQAAVA
jgi:hypothetical protein